MLLTDDVLVVAFRDGLFLRKHSDLLVLEGVGAHAAVAVATYGADALNHLGMPSQDVAELHSSLADMGWLASNFDRGRRSPERRCTPLAEVLRDLDRFAVDIGVRGGAIVTANEALIIRRGAPSSEVKKALRYFVSRLDWFRMQVYASLIGQSTDAIQVAGDLPLFEPPENVDQPGPWARTFEIRGAHWVSTSEREPGWLPPPEVLAPFGDRLSALSVGEAHIRELVFDERRTLWLAVGEFALPNLRFTSGPTRETRSTRWCMGADYDRGTAVKKAAAEGLERFAMGDVRFGDLLLSPATKLEGRHLDPSLIVRYTTPQEKRHSLTPWSEQSPEWWVQGSQGGSAIWLPAALVFSPFDGGETWLAPGFASSNGAAAHVDRKLAMKAAWWELIERDAVMRTHLSGIPPARLSRKVLGSLTRDLLTTMQSRFDDVELVLMYSSIGSPVIGACGWIGDRFCLGAAAAIDLDVAAKKALTELLILGSEPFRGSLPLPEEVRTPEDHGRLYARPEMARSVRWMREGDLTEPNMLELGDELINDASFYVRQIGGWFVSRAIDPRLINLTFGWDNELLGHPAAQNVLRPDWRGPEPLVPHPLA